MIENEEKMVAAMRLLAENVGKVAVAIDGTRRYFEENTFDINLSFENESVDDLIEKLCGLADEGKEAIEREKNK